METPELKDIAQEIYKSGHRLQSGADMLFTYAKKMAECERNYRQALQISIIRLKSEGMQTTLIPDIARGENSELKYLRDLSEAEYKSAKDMIQAISTQMTGLQSLLKIYKEV